jgi:hypothetical protein
MRFFCGLDLAQASDYTASVLIERIENESMLIPSEKGYRLNGYEETPVAPELPHYHVRGLYRYPRGTLYPAIVKNMNDRMRKPPLFDDSVLVLDGTGVGAAVVDMFRVHPDRPCPIVPVLITAGAGVRFEAPYWHVAKINLVAAIQRVLQEERLKIADVPERVTLLAELQNFQVKITASANATYGAGEGWREGAHDDLVLALALALWYAERARPGVR